MEVTINLASVPIRTTPPPIGQEIRLSIEGTRVLISKSLDGLVVANALGGLDVGVIGYGLADCLVKVRCLLKAKQQSS